MTDEEFDQMVRDLLAMIKAHPEMNTVSLGPATIAEFEKRGWDLAWKPYPAQMVEGPVTLGDMLHAAREQQ